MLIMKWEWGFGSERAIKVQSVINFLLITKTWHAESNEFDGDNTIIG